MYIRIANEDRPELDILREKPQEVAIRFVPPISNSTGRRVRHASQMLEDPPDRSAILKLTVAVNPELVSWIMYWGAWAKVEGPMRLKIELQ